MNARISLPGERKQHGLDPAAMRRLEDAAADGATQRDLAERFHVTREVISEARRRGLARRKGVR